MTSALIVVDVQNDFLPGGALAVGGGDAVIAPVNALLAAFDTAVLTQDWHPHGHISFASSHEGKKPLETVTVSYGTQVLWPDHCVAGTPGAQFSPLLHAERAQCVIRKGFRAERDSYSGFVEADRRTTTGLAGYLRERGVTEVFVCGLATDFCVSWTALDAVAAGFSTTLITDASRAIDVDGSLAAAQQAWQTTGVKTATVAEVLSRFS